MFTDSEECNRNINKLRGFKGYVFQIHVDVTIALIKNT